MGWVLCGDGGVEGKSPRKSLRLGARCRVVILDDMAGGFRIFVVVQWVGSDGVDICARVARDGSWRVSDGDGGVQNMMLCVAIEGCEIGFSVTVVAVNDAEMCLNMLMNWYDLEKLVLKMSTCEKFNFRSTEVVDLGAALIASHCELDP